MDDLLFFGSKKNDMFNSKQINLWNTAAAIQAIKIRRDKHGYSVRG